MSQFKAFTPTVEVNGETVLSVLEALGSYKELGVRILADNGIKNPQAGQWYSQQAWLNAFKTISEKVGPSTLAAIGKRVPESAKWPPQVKTLEQALASIDVAYHMNHRGGEIGHYHYQPAGPRSGKMVCRNPYPSLFDQGLIQGVARKFAQPGQLPAVQLDAAAPSRIKGAEACTYLISW